VLSRRSSIAFVIVGVALRLWQYGAGVSLWLDEIALARSILDRSLLGLLTSPLAFDQSAPPGFLLIEKLSVVLLGPSDLALRLFPVLGSLVALVGFWRLAERVLDGMGPAVAVALFACAAPLVVYGAQVKQYSTDTAVAVLLLWLAVELQARGPTPRRAFWAGLAGAVAAWLSLPAAFLLIAIGASLLWFHRREPAPGGRIRTLVLLLALWGVSVLAAIAAGLATVAPSTLEYMRLFWAGGMMPHPVQAVRTLWPLNHLRWFFGGGGHATLGYPLPEIYLALMAFGFWSLWRRRRAAAAFLVAPILVTLAAAVARQYPFSDRLLLFLLPCFLVGLAEAVERVRRALSRRWPVAGALAAIAIVTPALVPVAALPPPYFLDDVSPALARLAASRRPGDRIYVYYGAGPAVLHYAARHGLAPSTYSLGGCHRGDGRRYLEELDTFRGEPRVWVVFAHSLSAYREEEDITRYMDAIGMRLDAFEVPSRSLGHASPPVRVLLYDLSDARRLGGAAAASFAVTGPSEGIDDWACGRGPLTMVSSAQASGEVDADPGEASTTKR
jgi:hypothetical protein